MSALERLEPRLRAILRADATLCITAGALAALAAAPVARLLGTPATVVVGVAGAALAAYGFGLAVAATRSATVVLTASRLSAAGDAAWVVGSVALVVGGAVAPVFLLVAVPVAVLGIAKARELGRRQQPSRTLEPAL